MKIQANSFTAGVMSGLALAMVLAWQAMPDLMIQTHESRYSVDDTIATLTRVAEEQGWVVPKVYDMQKSLAAKGYRDAAPMKIISLCQPHHASQVLAQDENKHLASIMPCRFGVYETHDGRVHIAGMNIGLISQMFGSQVAKAMQQAAEDEKAMLAKVIR
jgi:uncharacterized protein (DUF302 family)